MKLYKWQHDAGMGQQTYYFAEDSKGAIALLRIPGINGEEENINIFQRLNESYCQWLPLCGDTFPAGFYNPSKLFDNWSEFPELCGTKIMAWDEGIGGGNESQWVSFLIRDFKENALQRKEKTQPQNQGYQANEARC